MGQVLTPCDKIKLITGDCRDILSGISSKSVDLIITDPPYNLGLFMKKRNTNMGKLRSNHFSSAQWDHLGYDEWYNNMRFFFQESHRILKKKGTLLIFMSLIKIESIIAIAQDFKFYYKTVGVWHKKNPLPRNMNLHFVNSTEAWCYFINDGTTGTFNNNSKPIHDFVETAVISKGEKKWGEHPTQKPISLIEFFVESLSNENDVVLDPFSGSGTAGVVCKKLNRSYIGIEISSDYNEIASQRILDTI